jgi:hypothetical protein
MRPAARPAASSRATQEPRRQGRARGFSQATDSVSPRVNYLTADRLHATEQTMTPRDREVLAFASEFRLATGRQLARRFYSAPPKGDAATARAGRRALKRLTSWRVLDPLPRRIGGERAGSSSIVYAVGAAGVKLLARSGFHARRLEAPGTLFVAHTLAITELAVELAEADRDGVLELIQLQAEPACWRGFLGPGLARVVLKPDLYMRVGAGTVSEDRWFVECDMATQSGSTIRTKVDRHLAYWRSGSEPVHPRVLWTVPHQRRAEQIQDVLRHLPAEQARLFAVCLAGEVVSFLAAEARS